jgi:predicted O-methyltransferase YrrM
MAAGARARLRLPGLGYAASASRAIAADPYEGVERTLERVSEWREARRGPRTLAADPDGERRLHERLGLPWPCSEHEPFSAFWLRLQTALEARGLERGRGAFGGWDDGDAGLARLVWCVVRHTRPQRCVETGVARGLTTAVILQALQSNGSGRLWSIDLPPLRDRDLADQTAAAVPPELRERWTLLAGSSRRVLPALVTGLGAVDLFVHDSMHTTRNVDFELGEVWPRLVPGGVAIVDDVERNSAVSAFAARHPEAITCAMPADDGRATFAWLLAPQRDAA